MSNEAKRKKEKLTEARIDMLELENEGLMAKVNRLEKDLSALTTQHTMMSRRFTAFLQDDPSRVTLRSLPISEEDTIQI